MMRETAHNDVRVPSVTVSRSGRQRDNITMRVSAPKAAAALERILFTASECLVDAGGVSSSCQRPLLAALARLPR